VTKTQIGVLRLWLPDLATLNWPAIALIALSAVLLLRVHLAIGWVLGISAASALVLAQI
jgi:chromate transporter